MKSLIERFPLQLKEACLLNTDIAIETKGFSPQHVLICGMGGSGIGGSILSDLFTSEVSIPILISKNYNLPGYVNENSLVIFCSYSGNTEETLYAMNQALKANCRIACVTSGGEMGKIAVQNKIDCFWIPGGMPPRACLGYSMIQLLKILSQYKIISSDCSAEISKIVDTLTKNSEEIKSEALKIAEFLIGKQIIIYSTELTSAIGLRFKQQLNENSKVHAHCENIPEMNHNELVAWSEKNENMAVLFLRDESEFAKNSLRIELNEVEIRKWTSTILHVYAKGDSGIEKNIYLIHLLDWASLFLAELRNVDPMEINVLIYLKNCLSVK